MLVRAVCFAKDVVFLGDIELSVPVEDRWQTIAVDLELTKG